MKHFKITLLLTCFLSIYTFTIQAQKKITLEEIWGGAFRSEGLQALQSLNNGTEYVVQEFDRANRNMQVNIYDYASGEAKGSLFESASIDGLPFFETFNLSKDENKVLLGNDVRSIFRRSTEGVYHVYDLTSKELVQISEDAIRSPYFSPDATKVAYVFENNLYYKDLVSEETVQVTTDGKNNKIINGMSDWVYEEEFSIVRAFDWNADASVLAFLRFDETEVPEFSMDMFGTYGKQLYPEQEVFKYPKAGEKNAKVSLHLFDLKTKTLTQIDLGAYAYIPRLQWSKKTHLLSVQTTNRHQNELKLWLVDATNQKANLVLTETDEAYVDVTDNLTFLDDNSFIWSSEKDGWNHLYHYTESGKLKNQLTKGNWEVTRYYGYDSKSKRIFYQSTENGSVNRGIYSVQLNGKGKKELAVQTGTNTASFSANFTYFVNTFQSTTSASTYSLHQAKDGKLVRKIKDNSALENQLSDYAFSPKEISTIHVNGEDLNMWTIKPRDFSEDKAYPILMFQYSGPGSQSVSNTYWGYNDYWYQLLANEGYVVVCVDGRGTGYKGRDFKKVTQLELGKFEVEDQAEAAKLLAQNSWVDENRIGIWGWSYGGFMSSNAILQYAEVFSTAIAVAPVTSWRFYDTIYTERYMTTPQENAGGYDHNSPITHASKLEGNYLLIHGGGDDNVHVQNTMLMVEALVQANKQFDWRVYPDKNHGIYGGNTRLHLYTMMTNFILEKL